MKIRYNHKYNLMIIWDEVNLPVLIDLKEMKQLIPFKRLSNTKLHYPSVKVFNTFKGKDEIEYVHRIVKYSFEGFKTYHDDYVVDHINGNTFDYRPTNLRYLSRSDNAKNLVGYEGENDVKLPIIDFRKDFNALMKGDDYNAKK